jgi:hypothetical protein
LLLQLRTNPNLFHKWIEDMEAEEAAEAAARDRAARAASAVPSSAEGAVDSGKGAAPSAAAAIVKVEAIGIIGRIKEVRQQYESTKHTLAHLQGQLAAVSQTLRRVEGLYKWWNAEATRKFFLMSCGACLAFVFIPFRFIFAVIGTHHSGRSGDTVVPGAAPRA